MSTSYIIFDELASRYGLHTVHDWSLGPGAPRTRTSIIEGDNTLTSTARNGNRDLQTYLPLLSAALRRMNYKSFSDFWSTRASGLKAKINDRIWSWVLVSEKGAWKTALGYHRTSRSRWKSTTIRLLFLWVGWSQSRWEKCGARYNGTAFSWWTSWRKEGFARFVCRHARIKHTNGQIWVVSGNALVEIATKSSPIARHSFLVPSFFSCERQRGNAEGPIARISGGAPKAEESTRGRDQLDCWFLLYSPRIAGLLLDEGTRLQKQRRPKRLWGPSHEMRFRK